MFKTRLLSGIVLVIYLNSNSWNRWRIVVRFSGTDQSDRIVGTYKVVDVQEQRLLGFTGYLAAVVYYGIFIYRTDAVCDISYDCISGRTDGGICIFISGI